MILVVILFSTVIVIGGTFPELAGYILLGMYGAFLLAVVAIVIAFMATPYRLGRLFA